MVIAPHPPYSPDSATCDFALFPKLKMKLKGRRLETLSDIQRESQAVLDSIKENDFHGAFEAWKKKKSGIAVCVPKETAAKIEQVKPAFLFDLVRELSDTPRAGNNCHILLNVAHSMPATVASAFPPCCVLKGKVVPVIN
jgi:hypothetical protein